MSLHFLSMDTATSCAKNPLKKMYFYSFNKIPLDRKFDNISQFKSGQNFKQ